MTKEWFTWLNLALGAIILLLLLGAAYFELERPDTIPIKDVPPVKTVLPKNTFEQPKEGYQAIGDPAFSLQFTSPSVMLPNLQTQLNYFGRNSRPDIQEKKATMFFSLAGGKTPVAITAGSKLYLSYDRTQTPPKYVFSTDNAETPLWIEPEPQGNQALVKVFLRNEQGELIRRPSANAQFLLPEKEYSRFGGGSWEIGKLRVDGTLLARQRARWFGPDRFLEKHGGEEYSYAAGKQRIDFGENQDAYSVFVAEGGCLVWDNDRWQPAQIGINTLGKPLLCVKKIDNRLMNLELWDPEGKAKVALNLLKSMDPGTPKNLIKEFKFIGARTLSQFVFEINKERVLLSPQDWLLKRDTGWQKLEAPEDIDDYVNRKVVGPLFVFDGVEQKDDRPMIVGTIFNPTRSDMETVEIPIQQNVGPTTTTPEPEPKQPTNGEKRPARLPMDGEPPPLPPQERVSIPTSPGESSNGESQEGEAG